MHHASKNGIVIITNHDVAIHTKLNGHVGFRVVSQGVNNPGSVITMALDTSLHGYPCTFDFVYNQAVNILGIVISVTFAHLDSSKET